MSVYPPSIPKSFGFSRLKKNGRRLDRFAACLMCLRDIYIYIYILEAIVVVLATQVICMQCHRASRKRIAFQHVIMTKLPISFNSCLDTSVDIQFRCGQLGELDPLRLGAISLKVQIFDALSHDDGVDVL